MDTKLLKQKILDLAIRGKLVPQDPNDEPASVLLEKIKKEKQELIKQGKIKKDKNESIIFVGDDKQHYEKFANGTIKNIEEEIPFEIPETWCWINGYGLFLPMIHIKPNGNSFQYIDINCIDNKTHSIPKIKILPTNQAPSRASRKINIGDTLFSMVRPYLENISYIDKRFNNAIASTGFFVCSTILINKKYIYYLMISRYVIDGLNTFMKGDNSPSINADNIFKFLFPIPPLAEQDRIVAKIEELFALVDKIEEEKQSLLKLIDKTKEKVLDLAMKGKLVEQDPNDEPASVLLENIFEEKKKLAKEGKIRLSKDELLPPKISVDNDYYEKFKSEHVVNLGNICFLNKPSIQEMGDLPYLEVKYLRNQIPAKLIDKGMFIESGSNIILVDGENSGEVFKTNENGYMGSTFMQLIIPQHINPNYVKYFINSKKSMLKNNKKGSAIPHLNKELFKILNIYLPSINEQNKIVLKLDNFNNLISMIKA